MTTYLEAVTALGKSSLHPGGFRHTLDMLKQVKLSANDIVLDMGCGTGRTACHIAKHFPSFVFALDNSKEMLKRARHRGEQECVQVEFLYGDADNTPFQDSVLDLIIIESVLVFTPAQAALRECHRILKDDGILACIEMYADKSIPDSAKEQIQEVCSLPDIPFFEQWLEMFQKAGFTPVKTYRHTFPNFIENIKNIAYPDPYQMLTQDTDLSEKAKEVLQRYRQLVLTYNKYLGYGTLLMKKTATKV